MSHEELGKLSATANIPYVDYERLLEAETMETTQPVPQEQTAKNIHSRMGRRMIDSGLITPEQCRHILGKQHEYHMRGLHFRFGDVAVLEGYCTPAQIESLPGFIGDVLIKRGFITAEQRRQILEWQGQLKQKHIYLRFGDIAVNEGFVERDSIERLLASS